MDLLVLTEDSSPDASATVFALSKKALALVEPCDTSRLRMEPVGRHAAAAGAVANAWKSHSSRARTELARLIADWISRGDGSFVLFHVDGDRPWSERATSENVAKLRGVLLPTVRRILVDAGRDPAEADARVFLLVPFYSIETWCYQNTTKALQICEADPRLAGAVVLFRAWAADPTALDEVVGVKRVCALGSAWNRALAEGAWPADKVYRLDRSFTASVHDMALSEPLVAALKRTWEREPS